MRSRRAQRGLHLLEFAVGGVVFFLLLFAVIEFGRLLFTWHALDEISRRAARLAAVCPVGDPAVARAALFNAPTESGPSPVLPTLSDTQVTIEYLDGNGTVLADPVAGFIQIRFVRAAIRDFDHTLMIPLAGGEVRLPEVTAVLPRESLGVSPSGTGCF